MSWARAYAALYRQAVEDTQAALGEAVYAAAYAEGHTLPLNAAVALALALALAPLSPHGRVTPQPVEKPFGAANPVVRRGIARFKPKAGRWSGTGRSARSQGPRGVFQQAVPLLQ